jgi:hypothetical protein
MNGLGRILYVNRRAILKSAVEMALALAVGSGAVNGGGRGIRTPVGLSPKAVFKTACFNRSHIPPGKERTSLRVAATWIDGNEWWIELMAPFHVIRYNINKMIDVRTNKRER